MNLQSDDLSIRRALDAEAAALDRETLQALDAARQAAVAACYQNRQSDAQPDIGGQAKMMWPVWLTSAAAAILAVAIIVPNYPLNNGPLNNGPLNNVPANNGELHVLTDADMEMIETVESLELLQEDPEFFAWLALQEA